MFVKNTSPKIIGFGEMVLLPGAVDNLPSGFGEDHPTIKFYFAKGWLKKELITSAEGKAGQEPKAQQSELDLKLKAIARMNREALRGEATALGIEFAEADTNKMLIEKITEKLMEAEEKGKAGPEG